MKLKKWLLAGLVIVMSLGFSSVALAAAPAAPAADGQRPVNGCQPGADNGIVQEWQLFNHEGFVEYLVNRFGYTPDAADIRSEIMFDFCDHNLDEYVCVMQQNLPNDASGRSTYWLAEDNHPFGGK